ncbi:MAG: exodeoxyribonuclease VII large subunit [bacterium]
MRHNGWQTQQYDARSMAPNQDNPILTVTQLNRQARLALEQRFNQVWVMGEMSNFARPRSGHWYFSLKDENAQVRCAMFANRNRSVALQPGDGQLVIARGRVSLYEGRGDFQVIVESLEAAGEGALRQAFDQLKLKLAAEGLFDAQNKRALPEMPQHVAVITSPTGAAIRDVIAVWQRRFPSLRVTVIPSAVQGPAAEAELLAALQKVPQLEPDIVLLTRGGGSLEDLWSFNLESVARALAACAYPTVSAVGHEIDVSICDFVADVRAPTPSAAAELIAPDAAAVQQALKQQLRALERAWQRDLHSHLQQLKHLQRRLPNPEQIITRFGQRIDDANLRLEAAISRKLDYLRLQISGAQRQLQALGPTEQLHSAQRSLVSSQRRLIYAMRQRLVAQSNQLAGFSRMLHGVSPLPTINRGFALVENNSGSVVTSLAQLSPGDTTTTYLQDGAFVATVDHLQPGATLTNRRNK